MSTSNSNQMQFTKVMISVEPVCETICYFVLVSSNNSWLTIEVASEQQAQEFCDEFATLLAATSEEYPDEQWLTADDIENICHKLRVTL